MFKSCAWSRSEQNKGRVEGRKNFLKVKDVIAYGVDQTKCIQKNVTKYTNHEERYSE